MEDGSTMDPRSPLEPTGEPAGPAGVDTELSRLTDLPVAEHAEIFAGIHERLTTALAATGQEPGRPAQPVQQRGR